MSLEASAGKSGQPMLPKFISVPRRMQSLGLGAAAIRSFVPKQQGKKEGKKRMNLNQLTIIGFVGRPAETTILQNDSVVTKFTVATKKSWKDDEGKWQEKSQWHNIVAWGKKLEQVAPRLVKGAHVLVQGELTTRQYNRTIQVTNGKKTIEHTVKQLVVELNADTIRILDRSQANEEPSDADAPPVEGEAA